jgi:hypothetical protein
MYLVTYASALMHSMETQGSATFLTNTTDRNSIDVTDSSMLPFLFLGSLRILSGSDINVCVGDQHMKLQ